MAQEPEEEESTEARFRRVQEELRSMELPEVPDEEIEAKLETMKGGLGADLPHFDDPLTSLEARAGKARGVHRRAMNAEPSRIDGDRRASKGLGVGLASAYTMIGLPLVGAILGFLLNKAVPGPWVPLGVVVGFVAGVAFALFLGNREKDGL